MYHMRSKHTSYLDPQTDMDSEIEVEDTHDDAYVHMHKTRAHHAAGDTHMQYMHNHPHGHKYMQLKHLEDTDSLPRPRRRRRPRPPKPAATVIAPCHCAALQEGNGGALPCSLVWGHLKQCSVCSSYVELMCMMQGKMAEPAAPKSVSIWTVCVAMLLALLFLSVVYAVFFRRPCMSQQEWSTATCGSSPGKKLFS